MDDFDKHLQALEGRILAQRRVLARLLAHCPEQEWRQLADWLADRQILHDGQEDPGAVPAEGMAQELAMATEFRELADLASRYRREE